MSARVFTHRFLVALVLGALIIPLALGATSLGKWSAAAQSLPFTPTPEPTQRAATATPTEDILPTPWPVGKPTWTPTPVTATRTATATANPYPAPANGATATATATSTSTATATPTARVVVATATPGGNRPTATAKPSPTVAPPGTVPDSCEPNDSLIAPCSLPTEADSKDMNFVDGSLDVYSFMLKPGRTYTVLAKAQAGLDPTVTVYLASAPDKVVAQNDDVSANDLSAQVLVTPPTEGMYLVKVESKTQGSTKGKTYVMSAKASSAPTSGTAPTGVTNDAALTTDVPFASIGDVFENNYDLDHATRLAWGIPYDLSQLCPDENPDACPGGDHDFFMVPVKKGVPFVAATYDLGPGADSLLTLYKPDETQTLQGPGVYMNWMAIASNDDSAPGWTLRSQLDVLPTWNGMALLVVAPSSRDNPPQLPQVAGPPARYRLIVGSPEMGVVKEVLRAQQTELPATPAPTDSANGGVVEPAPGGSSGAAPAAVTPQVAPPVAATPATGVREVLREACATGTARTRKNGVKLYGAVPPLPNDELATFGEGAQIKLLGQCNAGWVKVQPLDSVVPGWMWGPDLQPDELGTAPTRTPATGQPNGTPTNGTSAPNERPTAAPTSPSNGSGTNAPARTPTPSTPVTPAAPAVTAEPLDAEPVPTQPIAAPASYAVTVEICTSDEDDERQCGTPLVGLRVELVLAATQTVQVAGITDAQGRVTLSSSVPGGTKLVVRVGALGVQAAVSEGSSTLPIRVQAKGADR